MCVMDTIICGDNVSVLGGFGAGVVDLVVTSPPYDGLRDYCGYCFDFEGLADQLFRVLSDGGVVVWVVGDQSVDGSETLSSFRQALYFQRIGFRVHDTMIYRKSGFSNPSNNRYHQVFEYMFVFSKGAPRVFNPLCDRLNIETRMGGDAVRQKDGSMRYGVSGGVLARYGKRFNVWEYAVGGGVGTKDDTSWHPAPFPDRLAGDHILSWSNEGDVVLDPFSGSGTTCKMAMLYGRRYLGIEISENYVRRSLLRLQNSRLTLFDDQQKGNDNDRRNTKLFTD